MKKRYVTTGDHPSALMNNAMSVQARINFFCRLLRVLNSLPHWPKSTTEISRLFISAKEISMGKFIT